MADLKHHETYYEKTFQGLGTRMREAPSYAQLDGVRHRQGTQSKKRNIDAESGGKFTLNTRHHREVPSFLSFLPFDHSTMIILLLNAGQSRSSSKSD